MLSTQTNSFDKKSLKFKYFAPYTIDTNLCYQGILFVQKRFNAEWGILRRDVNYWRIWKRHNVVLFYQGDVIGWLGIESGNELTNACIDDKFPGVLLLSNMLWFAQQKYDLTFCYAHVPIEKTGSARSFLSAGLRLEKQPSVKCLNYHNTNIRLVKLIFPSDPPQSTINSSINDQIKRIRQLYLQRRTYHEHFSWAS